MRSFFLASAIVGLANALPAPAPQDIDFDLAYALPEPTYTTASDATAQIVTYNPSTVFSAALSQITASNSDTAEDTTTTDALQKRTACAPQPTGAGPVPSPDSASAFLALPAFSSAAVNAPVPSGYTQTFSNLDASNNAYGYMGYSLLQSYDSNACANKCNAINGCISFNIFFERDPTVDPGTGSSGCADPASTTNIKCVFWGGPVNADNAVNAGQWRNNFQVVIAGSNGYTNNSIAQVPGYTTATPLGKAAINAPYDQYGFNSYMGSAIFVGAFNAQLCADACSAKSAYAIAHPPTDGTPVQTCQFFNTYILYINSTSHIQGQYCAMYSESWDKSYATNVGQYQFNDHFLIEYSFSYSNATNAGAAAPLPAVYQAKKDIEWPANSAEPFCSSILGYTTPLTTVTSTATTTVSSITTTIYAKRQATSTSASARHQVLDAAQKRDVAEKRLERAGLATPAVLTKYPASIVTSACSLAATPVTITSTVVSSTTTTDVITATTVPIPCGQTVSGPYDGFSITVECNETKGSAAGQQVAGTSQQTSFHACLVAADENAAATSFTYQLSTQTCTLYQDANLSNLPDVTPNSDFVYGYFPQ